ncbi:hypothetical protein GBAR_LOCUS16857, partial [Geodia barretti]
TDGVSGNSNACDFTTRLSRAQVKSNFRNDLSGELTQHAHSPV